MAWSDVAGYYCGLICLPEGFLKHRREPWFNAPRGGRGVSAMLLTSISWLPFYCEDETRDMDLSRLTGYLPRYKSGRCIPYLWYHVEYSEVCTSTNHVLLSKCLNREEQIDNFDTAAWFAKRCLRSNPFLKHSSSGTALSGNAGSPYYNTRNFNCT